LSPPPDQKYALHDISRSLPQAAILWPHCFLFSTSSGIRKNRKNRKNRNHNVLGGLMKARNARKDKKLNLSYFFLFEYCAFGFIVSPTRLFFQLFININPAGYQLINKRLNIYKNVFRAAFVAFLSKEQYRGSRKGPKPYH
jgi:hypothetical protein